MVGAQWTGIVTTIAIEMLKAGKVEAVICVQRWGYIFIYIGINIVDYIDFLDLLLIFFSL